MINIRFATALGTALLLAAVSSLATADQVYRWVDKDGHVHYSQTPPSSTNINAQTMNIAPPPPDPTTLRDEQDLSKELKDKDKQSQEQQQKEKAAQAQQEQQQKECDYLQQRLQVLERGARVSTMDAEGNRTYVSDDDRAKQEQELQDQINKQCGSSSSNH